MLANFEELILKCPDEKSRSHIREAIRCYEIGTYRAAIAGSYIAVCFNLIEKLRYLANEGDGDAKVLMKELEGLQKKLTNNDGTAISGLLKFERELPIIFRDKFEFFGSIEFDDIQRLVNDRNRCAHPTFLIDEEPYNPSAEVARLHIRNALDLVLTQEPKQGKAALNHLRTIVTSASFPKDDDEVLLRIRSSPLKNARDALVRGFIDETSFGIASKSDTYYTKAAAAKAAEAALIMYPAIAFPRYCSNIAKLLLETEPAAVKYGALMALRSPDIANALDPAARPYLRSFILSPSGTTKIGALQRALKIDWLYEVAKSEISKLDSTAIGKLRREPAPETIARAVEIISSVKSFDAANTACGDLLTVIQHASEEQITFIFDAANSGNADLKGSYGFDALLQVIAFEGDIGKPRLQELLATSGIDEPTWVDPRSL